jgi:serine dehydrogenase proteinase
MNSPAEPPDSDRSRAKAEVDPATTVGEEAPTPPLRTPFYEAANAERYGRQAQIAEIERLSGRRLICYVSRLSAEIDRDDTVPFVDLLYNVPAGTGIDLLLHTPGGDIDAAEKLAAMMRSRVGQAELRVIVPDLAKSAGTLLALAADRIMMSDSSELGPIDPQIRLADRNGNLIQHSVQSYLDAYEQHAQALRENPSDAAAQLMLSKMSPETVRSLETVRLRAQRLAEDQLKLGMFRRGAAGNYTKIASELIDTNKWVSHGQMIDAQAAQVIGLTIEYASPEDDLWRAYWRLYCAQRLAVAEANKLFESNYVSLCL